MTPTPIDNLTLYHLPINEQRFADDPDHFMQAALQQHSWLASCDMGIVITERDAVDQIMRMDKILKTPASHMVEIMGGEGTNWARFQHECLIARDGEIHERIRNAVNRAFTPRAAAAYRERIQQVITELLDEWVPKGRFDFEAFASRFPVAVMFGMLGIPRENIEDVKHWLEAFGQSFSLNRELFPQIDAAFNGLWDFAEDAVARRRRQDSEGGHNVLDTLIAAEDEGTLSHVEVIDLILFMFAGGYDTSKNQLGHIMNFMLDRPEMWQRCAEDRNYCEDVMYETFRHSGVSTSYRNVATEFTYNDVTFPANTMLIFPLGIVCRYGGALADPMEFQPGRDGGRAITVFGRGMHICLGQFLARLQIAEGLHLMAQRIKNPRRDGELVWRLFPGVYGPLHLPIAFDPE
jgi:cytochrome P450